MIASRARSIVVAIAAVASALALSSCAPKTVRVETGTRVVCTYGETISSTVKTIDVPADKASSYGVVTKVVTCSEHEELQTLYAAAQAAIAGGDMKTASAKLSQVIALDPAFRHAKVQLDAIRAGKTPAPDEPSAPSTPASEAGNPGASVTPVVPTSDLNAWLPDVLSGYSARQPIVDVYSVSRQYIPVQGSSAGDLVIAVDQFATATAARAEITYVIARQYSQDVSTRSVSGRRVRFGSDGRLFATAAWNEGGVLIVAEEDAAGRAPRVVEAHLATVVAEILR